MRSKCGNFEFSLLVHSKPVTEYQYQGETLVEGREKSKYKLRLVNQTNRDALFIVSVDGLSIMNGQPASEKDSGYIVHAHDSVEIPGWRLNDETVAQFLFGAKPEAYASQMGQPQNIGVIGAMIFLRQQRIVRLGFCGSGSDDLNNGNTRGIGTGFGEKTEHGVRRVSFIPEPNEAAIIRLRYDTAEGLKDRGISVTSSHPKTDMVMAANPFPGKNTGCNPPPGWRG